MVWMGTEMAAMPFVFVAVWLIGGVVLIVRRGRIAERNRATLTMLGRPGLAIRRRSTPSTIAFVGSGWIVIGLIGLGFALARLDG